MSLFAYAAKKMSVVVVALGGIGLVLSAKVAAIPLLKDQPAVKSDSKPQAKSDTKKDNPNSTPTLGKGNPTPGKEPEKKETEKSGMTKHKWENFRPNPDQELPWTTAIDPSRTHLRGPTTVWSTVPIGPPQRKPIFPVQPSLFVLLSVKQPKVSNALEETFQVHDLLTGRSTGKPVTLKTVPDDYIALTPDGKYLAERLPGRENSNTIEVFDTTTGQMIRRFETGNETQWSAPIAFVGPDHLLMQTQSPEKTEYKVWSLSSGGVTTEFSFVQPWNARTSGLSGGGRYIVFHTTTTVHGHRFVAFDLTNGKLAGDVLLQPKSDPPCATDGIVFSPDGREIAVLWRLQGKKYPNYQVLVCDATTGKRVIAFQLGDLSRLESGSSGGLGSIQWIPDGSGWLLYGTLFVHRNTGKEGGQIPTERQYSDSRRFVGPEHITGFRKGPDTALILESLKIDR